MGTLRRCLRFLKCCYARYSILTKLFFSYTAVLFALKIHIATLLLGHVAKTGTNRSNGELSLLSLARRHGFLVQARDGVHMGSFLLPDPQRQLLLRVHVLPDLQVRLHLGLPRNLRGRRALARRGTHRTRRQWHQMVI